MWTTYSTINSTIKRKYGSSLKFVAQKNFFWNTMKPILNIKAEILSTNVVHVRFQKQLFCFRFFVVVFITKRSLFKKMKMLTSLHVDYIQHHKFNHQEKIWIIFEVCCPEKLVFWNTMKPILNIKAEILSTNVVQRFVNSMSFQEIIGWLGRH